MENKTENVRTAGAGAVVRPVEVAGIVPVIDGCYGMEDLPAALVHLARGPFGRIVVAVDPHRG